MNSRAIAVAVAVLAAAGIAWYMASPDPPGEKPQTAAPGGPPAGGPGPRGGMQAVAVITAPVREVEFNLQAEALGTARANESVDVTAKISNRVVSIRFREGQQVKEGEVLVELDAAEARADLAAAEAALRDSRSQFNRSRELYETKALSESQLEQLEATLRTNEAKVDAARARVNDTVIRAPFAGRVGLRNLSVGSLVSPGAVITTLDDTSVIKLDFTVPETFISTLDEGQEIQARSPAYPNAVFRGKVASIATRVDPVSRSVVVRASIDNRDGRLKPGMFLTVNLTRSEGLALMMPEEAIVPENQSQYVFLVRDGRASKTQVTIGRRRPGEVEVLQGLQVGDEVVIEGAMKLIDGSPVEIANTNTLAETQAGVHVREQR